MSGDPAPVTFVLGVHGDGFEKHTVTGLPPVRPAGAPKLPMKLLAEGAEGDVLCALAMRAEDSRHRLRRRIRHRIAAAVKMRPMERAEFAAASRCTTPSRHLRVAVAQLLHLGHHVGQRIRIAALRKMLADVASQPINDQPRIALAMAIMPASADDDVDQTQVVGDEHGAAEQRHIASTRIPNTQQGRQPPADRAGPLLPPMVSITISSMGSDLAVHQRAGREWAGMPYAQDAQRGSTAAGTSLAANSRRARATLRREARTAAAAAPK